MFKSETTLLAIEGMTCGNCVAHIENALKSVKGVKVASVDLAAKTAEVKHKGVPVEALLSAVVEAGYIGSHNE